MSRPPLSPRHNGRRRSPLPSRCLVRLSTRPRHRRHAAHSLLERVLPSVAPSLPPSCSRRRCFAAAAVLYMRAMIAVVYARRATGNNGECAPIVCSLRWRVVRGAAAHAGAAPAGGVPLLRQPNGGGTVPRGNIAGNSAERDMLLQVLLWFALARGTGTFEGSAARDS